jgi:dTDP-4-dehydrorhamnose reductase
MKVLILGGSGLLGHKLVQVFRSRFDVAATFHGGFEKYSGIEIFDGVQTVENFAAENIEQATNTIAAFNPDVIVNAIGITKHVADGDDAIKTISVNSLFPHQLAKIAAELDTRLIHISTDCVFSGAKGNYNESDVPDATDLYGKSKCLGEVAGQNCLNLRTSIIGRELFTRNSLVEWFLSNRDGRVKGFTKAIFTGFPTIILAEIIADIIDKHQRLHGLYHVSSEPNSKFDLLNFINDAMNLGAAIEPDNEFVIDRSLDSTRFRNETGFAPESWPEMIKRMADDALIYEKLTK